jgi:hypothetical protein
MVEFISNADILKLFGVKLQPLDHGDFTIQPFSGADRIQLMDDTQIEHCPVHPGCFIAKNQYGYDIIVVVSSYSSWFFIGVCSEQTHFR